jgi:hypothetical protein
MHSKAGSNKNSWKQSKLTQEEFEKLTTDEIKRRLKILDLCIRDSQFKADVTEMARRCPKFFINNFGWTFDPRTARKKYPFVLFPYQEEYIDWLEERLKIQEWGHVDKTRDVGATWMNVAHSLQKWLFIPNFMARFGSITEQKVDDRTIDSTFGKARFMIEHLPAFLKPPIVDGVHDKYLNIHNPTNGALLKGESMNLGFGRSGRASITHMDEFAHVQNSQAVLSSMSQTSRCAIFTSTPQGSANEFARMKKEGKIPHISLHWTKHPLKTKEWYEAESEKLPDWMIAQELDISYERSTGNRYYKRFDRQFHVAKEIIRMDENLPQYVYWDFGHGGAMAVLFLQVTAEGEIQVWQDYEVSDQDIDFCLPITQGRRPIQYELLKQAERKYIDQVIRKVPENFHPEAGYNVLHGGDNAGVSKTANSKRSCKDAIKQAGFQFKSSGKQFYDWRWKCVDNILKLRQNNEQEWYSRLKVSPDCERFIECMFNASFDGSNPHTDNPKPKLDQFFHMVSAFEFFCINEMPLRETTGAKEVTFR